MSGFGFGFGFSPLGALLNQIIPEYEAVLSAMTTKPNETDKRNQNKWLKQMVDGGYFAKSEFLLLFSTHTGGSLINWKEPGVRNPTLINEPAFADYKGYTGDQINSRAIRTNVVPYNDFAIATPNSVCFIIGIATNLMETRYDFGATDGGNRNIRIEGYLGNTHTFKPSGTTAPYLHASRGIGHLAFSVINGSEVILQKNSFSRKMPFTPTAAFCTNELYVCGYNNYGTLNASNKQIRYLFAFSGLTESEILDVINKTEEYLTNYSSGLMLKGELSHSLLKRVSSKTLVAGNEANPWTGRPFMIINDLGEWMVAYVKGADHSGVKTAHLRFSQDEGVTWSDEDILADGTVVIMPTLDSGSTSCAAALLMNCPNGDIILTCYETGGTVGNYQWRSLDYGKTWISEGRILGNTYLMEEDYCIVGADIYVIVRSGTGAGKIVYLYKSTDNGASWGLVSTIQGATTNPNETGLAYLGNNTFIAVVKDTNFLKTYQNISTDGGMNWTLTDITAQVGVVNKPMLKVLDGKLYLYGRDYRDIGLSFTGVWVSSDNGTTWSSVFHPDQYSYDDCGYCDMMQRSNGEFYMISYIGNMVQSDLVEYIFKKK